MAVTPPDLVCEKHHDGDRNLSTSSSDQELTRSQGQESPSTPSSPQSVKLRLKITVPAPKQRREPRIDEETLKLIHQEASNGAQAGDVAHLPNSARLGPLTWLAHKERDAVRNSLVLKEKVYERIYARTGQSKEPDMLSQIEKFADKWAVPYAVDEEYERLEEESTLLSVYSIVYTCAKLVAFICFRFGISLDWSPREILFHIQQAERVLGNGSIPDLIRTTENLYYVLYGRVISELGNVYACKGNHCDEDEPPTPRPNDLPEPMFMLDLFNTFKRILESDEVCKALDKSIKEHIGAPYIHELADHHATELFNKEPEVFQYYEKVRAVLQPEEPIPSHGLHGVCRMVPETIFAVVGEKYSKEFLPAYFVTRAERVYRGSVLDIKGIDSKDVERPDYTAFTQEDREFVEPEDVGDEIWEWHNVLAHRARALAKLEGKSIGEVRRDENDSPHALMQFVRERRCICTSQCSCAVACTDDPVRFCPHAEKQMVVVCSKQRLEQISDICDMMAEIGITLLFQIKDTYRQEGIDDLMDNTVLTAIDRFRFVLMEHRHVIQYRSKCAGDGYT